MLVEAGVVEAVAEALNKFVEGEKIKSVGSSGLVQSSKLPPFLPGHLTLLNSLLSSSDLSPEKQKATAEAVLKIVRGYFPFISSAMRLFPTNGDVWLEIVQALALASSATQFRISDVDKQLTAFILEVLNHLLQFPFPGRLLPVLAENLRGNQSNRSWWDEIEQSDEVGDDEQLPNPPAGPSFSSGPTNNETGPRWTQRKYEACVAGAKVINASLALILRAFRRMDFTLVDIQSLACGLCRLSDSSRAMNDRIGELDNFEPESGTNLEEGELKRH
mmetsp:Transcript_8155/g.13971  ORF Transcript_8155/g.13971 Transcript_8155/m.13971 type:complete len:275 (-) Transcript_8155:2-826(-)